MRLRWYNPALGDFEWRETPENDEETLTLLGGPSAPPPCVRVYREWRELGASVAAALIRPGNRVPRPRQRARRGSPPQR